MKHREGKEQGFVKEASKANTKAEKMVTRRGFRKTSPRSTVKAARNKESASRGKYGCKYGQSSRLHLVQIKNQTNDPG